jgi:hypothetical protein
MAPATEVRSAAVTRRSPKRATPERATAGGLVGAGQAATAPPLAFERTKPPWPTPTTLGLSATSDLFTDTLLSLETTDA